MKIIPKNNTFENTQITSFLNKLDALIASGYADADDYSALIQCCLNVENAPENQRQVAGDVVNVLRTFKIELLANNSQKEFALQKFGKHLHNANLPIDIIKLLTVLFCKVFKTISADIAFKLLQEQFLNFNESDWQNFKTQYNGNAERNNFKDADFSADLHLIQNYFENFQNISANQFQQIKEPLQQVANDAVTAFEAKRERNVVAITNEVAEPEISQAELATGTDGDLPTQKSASIIENAEAQKDAPANFKTNIIKGDAQKDLTMILNENTHTANNNAENATENTTNATNSASNIKTPPATKQAEKTKTSNKKPKFEFEYFYNSTYEKIADALDYISSDIGEAEWYKFIDALKNAENTFGGDFKSLADKWSRQASNYESKAFESKWKAKKGDIDYKFIFNEAISHGWQNKPARDENYSFSNNFSSQNSNNFSNQNSNNKKENANNNAVPAEVKNKAKYILSQAKEYTNNHFDALKNHYYFKHLTNFHNVYLNYYKEQISAVIPQFDINTIKNNDVSTAEVISLQFIFFKDDGTTDKRPLTGGSKHFTYFECCKEAAKEPKDILFCEGVRTGLAVATALTGSKVLIICCLDAGNLATVATKFKTLFPDANFGFLADNDIKENSNNVGVEAAFQAAKEINASLFIPNYLSDLPPEKCDFYDVLKHYNEKPFENKNGVEVIKEILKNDCFSKVSNEISNLINNNQIFTYFDDNGNAFHCSNTSGLIVIENTGKTDENGDIITNKIKLLNKPFFVAGEFFDKVNQNNHGYIIEFKNIAGTLQRMPVKSAELATDAVKSFNFLFANGLKKITTKINLKNLCEKYLLSYLNCFNFEKNLFNYTNKSGWQGDCCDVYIRPAIADAGEIYFGENENNKYFYENTNNQITFTAKGNLAEWKENVGKYIKGNPLLIVALLQCLTGFFLKELKFNDCIYFNVVGLSSSGKSVLLNVCRSLISGNNLNLSWGGSISGVENVLKQFNHCFIPVDELTKISESDLKNILKVIYSNTGRMLATRSGNSNREIKRWLLTGISTSEKTFKEIAQQYKYNTMDGQEVRFIDIEFTNLNYKYGVFKTVAEPTGNNTTDGQIFAKMLRDNSNTFYGTPMIELLKYLTAPSNENNNVKNITKIHSYLSFVEKNLNLCKNYFPATLNRIASYFNNLIAVGSMLSKGGDFELLPVEKCDILNAVLEVFNLVENKFKNDDGGYTTCTGANIYQNLTSFILQNENRFRPRLKPEIGDFFEPDKCAGYYDLVGSNAQGKNKIYYIFTDIFENEIAKDIPKKTALRELEKLGYIQKGRLCYKTEIRFYDRTSGSSENRIKLYKFENLFK